MARGGGLVCKEKEGAAMPGIYKYRETKCGVSCESKLSNYDGSLITVSSAIKPRLWWFVHGRPSPPHRALTQFCVVGGKWMVVGGGRLFGYWLLQEGAYLVRCHSTSTVFSVDT